MIVPTPAVVHNIGQSAGFLFFKSDKAYISEKILLYSCYLKYVEKTMKAFLYFDHQLCFFSQSVSQLTDSVQAQFFQRMTSDKAIEESETLQLEKHVFPLDAFMSKEKAFYYKTKIPDFVSLENVSFVQVDEKEEGGVKIVVLTPCYSFETGDEPEYRYSYFVAKNAEHFVEKFKEKAQAAFKKNSSVINFGQHGFNTTDYVHASKKETHVFSPEFFCVE